MIFLLALLLQSPPVQPQQADPPPEPPVSIERIKARLEHPGIPIHAQPPTGPVFRVQVRERPMRFTALWEDESMVPSYVQPRMPIEHYEFLKMVTPEEFRAGTLYPCCIDLVPLFDYVGDQIDTAVRNDNQARARRFVQKSLQLFGDVKKAPDR